MQSAGAASIPRRRAVVATKGMSEWRDMRKLPFNTRMGKCTFAGHLCRSGGGGRPARSYILRGKITITKMFKSI